MVTEAILPPDTVCVTGTTSKLHALPVSNHTCITGVFPYNCAHVSGTGDPSGPVAVPDQLRVTSLVAKTSEELPAPEAPPKGYTATQ